jgi:signal transduction histidine kinase
VDAPWWESPWARAAYLLAAASLLWLAYCLRVRHLLSLERQRLSIAMDLHDELGSSLGSIGALARVVSNPRVGASERRRLAGEIATAAQLAGAGLRSLVWTMRDGAVDAPGFGREIADQARRIAPRAPPELQLELPKADGGDRFDAPIRRQVLMIAMEALHNAMRHAGAEVIRISLAPAEGAWRLAISDDGSGFDPAAKTAGSGLESMRQRAARIGGRLSIESAPGAGAMLALEFPAAPRALLRRPGWMLRHA